MFRSCTISADDLMVMKSFRLSEKVFSFPKKVKRLQSTGMCISPFKFAQIPTRKLVKNKNLNDFRNVLSFPGK